jgi:hypothetical protein
MNVPLGRKNLEMRIVNTNSLHPSIGKGKKYGQAHINPDKRRVGTIAHCPGLLSENGTSDKYYERNSNKKKAPQQIRRVFLRY